MPKTLAAHIKVTSGWAFPSEGFNGLEGLPLIRIRDLGHGTTEVKFKGGYDPRYVIDDSDVLIGMDGDFAVEKWAGGTALLNQRVCKVESASANLDQGFLYWYLMPHVAEIHRRTPQTTVRHLSASSLGHIVAPPIPVAEQCTVNQILDTLDTTIRQTEAIIEKLKLVKQGLLHDLLTRGIDANGELRPPQSQASHLYKDSPLGWMPMEWGTATLGELATSSVIGPFGSDLVADDYRADGVPVVFVRDVKANCFAWKSDVFVSPAKARALVAHEVRGGDVVLTKMGLPPCVAAVYPQAMAAGIVTADIVRLRFESGPTRPAWVSLSINEDAVTKQVEQITAGVTRPKVTLRDVRKLVVRQPPVDEQDRILTRMIGMDQRIDFEFAAMHKLGTLKSGLMDDLLTGRVRVTPLLDAARA